MVGTPPTRRGVWEPLPRFIYGYAVHPLSPSRRDTRFSNRTRPASTRPNSIYTDASGDDHLVHRDVVSLEVGDEVYAFERYTPKDKEVEGVWYRGYVVCTSRRPQVTWFTSSEPSSSHSTAKAPAKVDEAQQVFIGIFPASHINIRDELSDAEGRLAEMAAAWAANPNGHAAAADIYAQWKDRVAMDPDGGASVRDEEDNADTMSLAPSVSARKPNFKLNPPPDQATSVRARLPVYAPSIRSASPTPTEAQVQKPLPPRPSLKPSDETVAGAHQPIIDEISSALREWHLLMFQYLARRDYKLFDAIREHIEGLHLGRRQLLAQTLSAEETVTLRRRCVARLVTANLMQGLDVIVRHPTWGGLVTVDVEGELDPRSWLSAVRMYAMQVSLAYMPVSTSNPSDMRSLAASIDYVPVNAPSPSPAHPTFADVARVRNQAKALGSLARTPSVQVSSRAKFFHIFLDLRAFVASPCAPGETVELIFSLFDKNENRFVSEEFSAILNPQGVLARDPTARVRTFFTDLLPQEAQRSIYLVCAIVRNGSMKMGSSMGPIQEGNKRSSELSLRDRTSGLGWGDADNGRADPSAHFRRPFGCAVLELGQLKKMEADGIEITPTREHTMPIYVPKNETTFSMLHQDIINGHTNEYEKSVRAELLAVSIKIFYGDSDTIIRENSSLLQDTPLTLRLGFPDVVFPGDVRNELYIKLWTGDFSASQTTSARRSMTFPRPTVHGNIQVSVEVRNQDGRTIDNVITRCSGEPPISQYHSMVLQRISQPTFNELIKVTLPPDGAQQWHLFFTFRQRNPRERGARRNADAQERPFAFAFVPLFPDGRAFLEDGEHKLALYKAERLGQITAEQYLASAPWILANQRLEQVPVPVEMQRIAPLLRDSLLIRSSLCSTKFTQNSVLLSLLNWQAIQDKDFLSTILTKFTFVGEVEIVKFLRDIFDSLFSILVSPNNRDGEMDHLVFNALVTVLGIVQDRRFSNFQPVLDVYIEEHFSCTSASSHMLRSMNRLLEDPTASETASALRAALKVWQYVFKFIVRSRELQKTKLGMGGGATAEHLESTFQQEVRAHLAEVNRMMSRSAPASIIGTQTIALQYFTMILPELMKVFPVVEVVGIATTFANAVIATKGKIVIWKLIMYLQIVRGFLFDIPQARAQLVESVVMWIKPHFGRFDEYLHTQPGDNEDTRNAARVGWLESIRLSITVVAVMLDKLQQNLVNPAIVAERSLLRKEQDNVELVLSLFPKLLESYLEFQSATNLKAVSNIRSPSTTISATPVTFPESYPFALLSSVPRSSPNWTGSTEAKTVYNAGLGETAIVILALALSSTKKHFLNFLEGVYDIEGREHLTALLLRLFQVASSILSNDAFPPNWLNVNILAHKVLLKIMDPIASLMENAFIPPEDGGFAFDQTLWREGFGMLLKLLSSEQLVIEEFSPQKRRAVWRLAGDIRGEGASILLSLWNALGWPVEDAANNGAITRLGNYQIALSPLVGQVVNLCLSIHDQLRHNAVQILYCMIVSEFHVSGHFEDIENELVNTLDSLFMSDSKVDDISRAFFIAHLRQLFETSDVDPELRKRLLEFLESVDSFLQLLLSVRALPEGEEFADDRVIATLRLMNFIRRIGRDEIYIKYVHQLVNMHLQSQNYVEAALTLKLHADLHDWDLHVVAPPMEDLGLPQQSQFHRKETLCLLILDYLGKGKAWESALEICKDLAFQHAEVTFNYSRLAEILRHQAALLEHIVVDQRYYSDYFRVAFYGNFPVGIRGRHYVYRGYEWEKFGAFCERMLNKHPGAQLLKTMGDPSVDVRFGTDQYIQCTALVPEPNRELPIFTNPEVPPSIRNYYEHSAINLFSYSRPIPKLGPDGSEEIWIEKTYLTTEETFPTVLRRSEVVEVTTVEISPVESALQEVQQRTHDLQGLSQKYITIAQTAGMVSTTPLSMTLNAAVDAPRDTGVSAFRQTFLSGDYVARYPDRAEQVEKLRAAIDEQVLVLDTCLKLHGQLCPPEMDAFHNTLLSFFRKNFQEEIQRLAVGSPSLDSSLVTRAKQLAASQYTSLPEQRIADHAGPSARHQFTIAPLELGQSLASPSVSTPSTRENGQLATEMVMSAKQTPLQKGLAHLARHGFNGVASGPRDSGDGDVSEESPRDSLVNGTVPVVANLSGAISVTTSNMGSVGGSLRGRFSRFGSLNFGRRDG